MSSDAQHDGTGWRLRATTRIWMAFIVVGLAGVSGCSDLTSSGQPTLQGTFALAQFNDQLLPADLGAVPTGGTCRLLIRDGSLKLEGTHFTLAYDVRNGCTDAIASSVRSNGTFQRSGDALTFTVDLGGGATRTDTGGVGDGAIVVRHDQDTLIFTQ